MAQHPCVSLRCFFLLVCASLWCADTANAVPVVWTGPNITFSKAGSDLPTLPASQDRLTSNVWLTRGSSEGLFNIAPGHESSYIRFTSPADTQWATDVMAANVGQTISATNWPNLTFTDWSPAYGGNGLLGGNITTHSAVVHLVTDDIYLNLSFTSFGGGGITDYSYQRSTAAAPLLDGDYNNNGTVDAADYVLWRKVNNTATTLPNDSTPGTDATDYAVWRAHFGLPAGSGALANAAVPEPMTLLQLILMAAAMSAWHRRGKQRCHEVFNARHKPVTCILDVTPLVG